MLHVKYYALCVESISQLPRNSFVSFAELIFNISTIILNEIKISVCKVKIHANIWPRMKNVLGAVRLKFINIITVKLPSSVSIEEGGL